MVSHYYNTLPYTQKHSAANLAYASAASQPWNWTPNYHHTPPNHQFLGDVDSSHAAHHAAAAHQMYYNSHHMFHSAASAGDWHSPASSTAENFVQNVPTSAHQLMQQHHHHHAHASSSSTSSGSSSSGAPNAPQLNETNSSIGGGGGAGSVGGATDGGPGSAPPNHQQHIAEGLPSPPITVSGSEISSPGAPTSASSPHHHLTHHLSAVAGNNNNSPSTHNNNNNNNSVNNNNNRTSPSKPQYYEWMKKPAYPAQPQPGKTRTKDKYRVVYTDYQRLELEKEYCTSRYITIRRKSELAQTLSLSERQVKIWFQNRRAKERKQNKKGSDPNVMGVGVQHADYSQLLDAKAKLDPGLHLPHSLAHSINPMAAMNIPAMRLHPHLAAHSHSLAAAAAHSHQLQQQHSAQMSAAAAVGTLSM
ncbi:LOW QUALITY PROTEIN: homeotic protein caudal [Drosophila ficusphila]|uniref:LOW QUALITY PROTEIN: homeotic protein caudal n=1 Tax=Drosophila ficusphila TaxID=30025 RepID=UPI0007E5F4FC|nr:LOW QUALITY PROTEIN: homeotic protein caudal [Drosophila ficusphila]